MLFKNSRMRLYEAFMMDFEKKYLGQCQIQANYKSHLLTLDLVNLVMLITLGKLKLSVIDN